MSSRGTLGYVSGSAVQSVYAEVYGTATGGIGSPTAVTIGGINYKYLTFNSTGTLTVTKSGLFDAIVIAGGGNGGWTNTGGTSGGGGGSGGLVNTTIYLSANQTVTIGAGQAGSAGGNAWAGFGTASSIGTLVFATGGGGGGTDSGAFSGQGASSGGKGNVGVVGTYIIGQGNSGSGTTWGGGGGFSAAGSGVNGGLGYDMANFIGGSTLLVAGGGGGLGGSGSSGGGNQGNPGTANTGGGSGGQTYGGATSNGGSGVVYIRFKV